MKRRNIAAVIGAMMLSLFASGCTINVNENVKEPTVTEEAKEQEAPKTESEPKEDAKPEEESEPKETQEPKSTSEPKSTPKPTKDPDEDQPTGVKKSFELDEGDYNDVRAMQGEEDTYYSVTISNVADTSFEFTIIQASVNSEDEDIIFNTNTAVFTGDGTTAEFNAKGYDLTFAFPGNASIEIDGLEIVDGITFVDGDIAE